MTEPALAQHMMATPVLHRAYATWQQSADPTDGSVIDTRSQPLVDLHDLASPSPGPTLQVLDSRGFLATCACNASMISLLELYHSKGR